MSLGTHILIGLAALVALSARAEDQIATMTDYTVTETAWGSKVSVPTGSTQTAWGSYVPATDGSSPAFSNGYGMGPTVTEKTAWGSYVQVPVGGSQTPWGSWVVAPEDAKRTAWGSLVQTPAPPPLPADEPSTAPSKPSFAELVGKCPDQCAGSRDKEACFGKCVESARKFVAARGGGPVVPFKGAEKGLHAIWLYLAK